MTMQSPVLPADPATPFIYTGRHNLRIMSGMSHYNRWIYETIAPYIGRNLLETGCGNGNITRLLVKHRGLTRYVGVDASVEFCREQQRDTSFAPGVSCEFRAMDLQDDSLLQLSSSRFDSIVCLNVLEHVAKDQLLLDRFKNLLSPAGQVILQVPAFQFLYGTIDEIDGHYRRYTRATLFPKLQHAGLRPTHSFYFNLLGIPAWVWHSKIRKLKTHTEMELTWWDKAVPLLQRLETLMRPPIGLSLFVIAESS